MASPFRSVGPNTNQLHALPVVPLNSMPYIGPPPPGESSMPTGSDMKNVENSGPSAISVPSPTTQKELDYAAFCAKYEVKIGGSAAVGPVGPIVGAHNILESDDSYLFRVSLPGVSRDEKDFSCNVQPDGTVHINGVTTTGEKTVCKDSRIFRMLSQNLGPPGRFSITFQLPGPVDVQQFQGSFGIDGIMEGLVKKQM